ncbi:unnamed protein product [Acanthoscelides obtectus]|uniref:PHD-type domain-containing protein n=2 Tax=Acanthoscelides obtectus TaxID=200917 RepID=A0A9P0NUY1_ACAOB|nr:unnamed protein product [Acanthoscelides obtectus]CAK1642817.1 Transcriptional regulator ATRX [Acanthoscelides obtectus]
MQIEETISTYEQAKSKHFVDAMDGTFKESGDIGVKENDTSFEKACADIDESHTDDEEDVPLNLDCSKSDDDDDLGESENEEKGENQAESDKKTDETSQSKIDTSEVKSVDENLKNVEVNGDSQEGEKKEEEKVEESKDEKKPEDESCQESEGCKDDVGVDSTGEENTKLASDEKAIEDVDMEPTESKDKEGVPNSDRQTDESESEKDSAKDCPENKNDPADDTAKFDHNGTDEDQTENDSTKDCPENKKDPADDRAKSDHNETDADKTKNVTEAEQTVEKEDSKDETKAVTEAEKTVEKDDSRDKENEEKDKNEEATSQSDAKGESDKNDKGGDFSLLKETLSKPVDDTKEQENDEEEMDEDFDPSDFDPSLLCPEVAMEVDEAPVIAASNDQNAQGGDDGAKSPILFDAVFSTYVDEMTGTETCFDLSLEEEQLRQETYGQKNPVQFTKIHCTACNVHLGSALDGQGNRFVHPLLKVLICKNCYSFYCSGEFEKDEDGSELYCRWCGQGGQVMCCAQCEMVFCKKCIRINFDRKKIADIRDSDDWLCFRCNPSQIAHLKIHCAEFMEYVRRERSRAATLENFSDFTSTDHALCCQSMKKKATDSPADQPKRKRKKVVVDPDYNPLKDEEDDQQVIEKVPHTVTPPATVNAAQTTPRIVPVQPPRTNGVSATAVQQAGPTVTQFRPRTSPQFGIRPKIVTIGQNAATVQTQRPPGTPSPGYIKILPGGMVVPGNSPRQIRMPAPRLQTTIRPQAPTQAFVRQRPQTTTPTSQARHEWFEKTVRAAARVNSNLSYTLTNLNRAQAAATSVEALAVVHNKLQEILSTSINSLIQIRKNLRAEFIQGIKNTRFPPKNQTGAAPATPLSPTPTPSTSKAADQDDDVIIISPASSPIPAAKVSTPVASTSKPSTSRAGEADRCGGRPFLRVKSLTALQNVTAECITIPDDPPEVEKPTEDAIDAKKKGLDTSKVIKVDITKILAGENPVVEPTSSKVVTSKEADKKMDVDNDALPIPVPEISKDKSKKEKVNCESVVSTKKTSEVKKKKSPAEAKAKDKTSVDNSSDKMKSDENKSIEKKSLEKELDTKVSEEKKTEEKSIEKKSTEKKRETKVSVEKKREEKKSIANVSKEKKSEKKGTEETKPDEKKLEEKGAMSEEEPTESSCPALKVIQDVKVVLERSKEVEGCVLKNQKTD